MNDSVNGADPRPASVPDHVLQGGLTAVLSTAGGHPIEVVERVVSSISSTYPTEIVRCRRRGQEDVRLFCKYSAHEVARSYGHRGSVKYEAEVYRRLLGDVPLRTPRFWGTFSLPNGRGMCLVLEFLDQATPLSWCEEMIPFAEAAAWAGRFHSLNQPMVGTDRTKFLRTYDADYYRGWADRTAAFLPSDSPVRPWVHELCRRIPEVLPLIVETPKSVIHGEFYAKNIVLDDAVAVVDWESAAVAIGEIDLACLTDGWPRAVRVECERVYRQSRWPNAVDRDHELRLEYARLYVALRWLGDRPEWLGGPEATRRYAELHEHAERLGLL